MSSFHLDEDQLNLVRDIRRRGKNKIAAQNCRKRKMDTLVGLEGDVTVLRRRREVFSGLRDSRGRPLDVNEFTLSFEDDGRVEVVSRRQRLKEKSRRKTEKK